MSQPDLTPKDNKLIRKANNNAGQIMFWLLIVAVVVVTPLEIRKFYQICQEPSSGLRDYLHPTLVISLHIILLRRNMMFRKCLRLIKKLHDALPEATAGENESTGSA